MNQLKYGQRLKKRRKQIGFSEMYVAKKLNISTLAYRSIEESRFVPTDRIITRLARLYGLPKELIRIWVYKTTRRSKIVIK